MANRYSRIACLLGAAFALSAAAPLAAQTAPNAGTIAFELNKVEDVGSGCRLTMVMANRSGSSFSEIAFEIAIFGTGGIVLDLLEFDFGVMDDGRTRVKMFDYPTASCAGIERMTVNGETRCGSFQPAEEFCVKRLRARSLVPNTQLGL